MEYVPGIKINRIKQLDKLGVDRKRYVLYTSKPWPPFSIPTGIVWFWLTWITFRLGRYAVESYLEQILSHGFFHADPVSRSVHHPQPVNHCCSHYGHLSPSHVLHFISIHALACYQMKYKYNIASVKVVSLNLWGSFVVVLAFAYLAC